MGSRGDRPLHAKEPAPTIGPGDVVIPQDLPRRWQDIADLVAKAAGVPVVLITRIESPNLRIMAANPSEINPYRDRSSVPMAGTYCEEVIRQKLPLLIPNALASDRWKDIAPAQAGFIWYFGLPLMWPNGEVFGTICLSDTREHHDDHCQVLAIHIRQIIEGHLDLLWQYALLERLASQKGQEAAKAERQWQAIFQALGHPAMLLDAQHRIIAANKATVKATSLSELELVGKTCSMVVHGTEEPPERCPLEKLLISGHFETVEMGIPALGGTYLVSCTPLMDAQGRLEKVIHISTDVTALKETRQALQQEKAMLEASESSLQAILQSTADGILAVSRENKVLLVNERFVEMWMIPQEVIASKEDSVLLQYVIDQLIDPQSFLQKVQELYKSNEVSFDTLYFKNGRVFDRLSRPLIQGTALRGRVWSFRDVTERSRAVTQLHQLAARHEAILSAVPDIIMEVDANKVYTWANLAGYEFFGKDVIGKEAAYYFEGEQDTYAQVKPLFNGDASVFYIESWQRRKDGDRRLLGWWCRALTDGEGRAIGALSTARDITDRVQAEQLLKDQASRLRSIMQAAPVGIGLSCNRILKQLNDRLCEMTGYSREELLESDPRFLYSSQEEYERVGRQHGPIRQFGASGTETQWKRKDGRIIDVLLNYAALNPNDLSEGVTFTALDITERKRAERDLKESEDRFQLAVQGANDGLWDWPDIAQERQWWSPRLYELLGYQDGEIEANRSNYGKLMHPDDMDRFLAAVRAHIEEGRPFDIEYRLRTKSGEYRWFHARGTVVRDKEGKTVRMSGSIRDITERRKAQADRATYQAKLKSLALRLALAEERERRRIAVGVHDDIGQKLVLAKLELQSLRETISESGAVQGVDRVCDLIDQSMQEARSLAFDLSNPVLYEVGFGAAVESWLSRQVEHKAGIHCDFASELEVGTKLDENTAVVLFQAVREVLTNVVKHARAKTVKVRIHKSRDEVQVVVEDDGVGFDPAILDWTAEHQRGLGLFNVKERLEYIKGRLEIRSAPGQGTKATLTVPFKVAVRAARPKPAPSKDPRRKK